MMSSRIKPPPITLEAALERIGEFIAEKQRAKKHATIPFEVSIDAKGQIEAVWVQPKKVKIA